MCSSAAVADHPADEIMRIEETVQGSAPIRARLDGNTPQGDLFFPFLLFNIYLNDRRFLITFAGKYTKQKDY